MTAVVLAGALALSVARSEPTDPIGQYDRDGVAFRYPASWSLYGDWNAGTMQSRIVAYVSNIQLRPPCSTLGDSTFCDFTNFTLGPGAGVVIVNITSSLTSTRLEEFAPGRAMVINGRRATFAQTGRDERTGAEAVLTWTIELGRDRNFVQITAYLRGPDLPHLVMQTKGIATSLVIST